MCDLLGCLSEIWTVCKAQPCGLSFTVTRSSGEIWGDSVDRVDRVESRGYEFGVLSVRAMSFECWSYEF